jgi:CRISPR-associated protein Cmr2
MTTLCDFYAQFRIQNEEEVDDLVKSSGKYSEIRDARSKIMLLNTALSNEEVKDYAKVGERNHPSGLKALIHSNGNYNDYIACKLSELYLLGINSSIEISAFPKGSWTIEFPITLAKPFMSKDDLSLYIIENPVRKDKVFGIPFTCPMSWKGNLRWAMMKVYLEPIINDPDKFAEIRFRHTLLFGTEKGLEEEHKGWARYLDELCPDAKELYRDKTKEKFGKEEMHNLEGTLYFYPTFWDRIDMEVINPHDRKTKTGRNPIYYEVVPKGAKGFFRLVYIPLYYLELQNDKELKKAVIEDLSGVVEGLKAMMLTYGFSAKKSTGYGVIESSWDTNISRLIIKDILSEKKFGNFEELKEILNTQKENFA